MFDPKTMDPQPELNRGEDCNETICDIAVLAANAIDMADLTSLMSAMETIAYLCAKTQTDPVDD